MEIIGRGTTPTHTFTTDRDLSEARVYVTYKQDGMVVVEKTNEDLVIVGNVITAKLSQKETLDFEEGYSVSVQIRYVDKDGLADKSEKIQMAVTGLLKDGEIVYE